MHHPHICSTLTLILLYFCPSLVRRPPQTSTANRGVLESSPSPLMLHVCLLNGLFLSVEYWLLKISKDDSLELPSEVVSLLHSIVTQKQYFTIRFYSLVILLLCVIECASSNCNIISLTVTCLVRGHFLVTSPNNNGKLLNIAIQTYGSAIHTYCYYIAWFMWFMIIIIIPSKSY